MGPAVVNVSMNDMMYLKYSGFTAFSIHSSD